MREIRRALPFLVIVVAVLVASVASEAATGGEDLVILLDRSGSMLGATSDQRGLAKALTLYLVDQARLAGPGSRVAVIPFANDVRVIPEGGLAPVGPKLVQAVEGIPVPVNGARTSMERALRKALQLLRSSPEGQSRRVILVSDGMPEPPLDAYPQLLAKEEQELVSITDEERRKGLITRFFEKAAKISREQIDGALLPQFRQAGIAIVPLILGTSAQNKAFLRHVAEVTIGDGAQAVVVKTSPILDLEKTVRRPPAVMPVDRFHQQAGGMALRRTVAIPPHAEWVQFLLHYPAIANPGVWKRLRVELRAPDGTHYDRGSKPYARALDHNNDPRKGTLVYERFAIPSPAPGEWEISVTDTGGRPLPPLDLLVDARTSLRLRLTLQPEVQSGAGRVEIAAQVVGSDGQPLPFRAATGRIATPGGQKTPLSFSPPSAGKVARASFPVAGTPPFGAYRVWVTAYLGSGKLPYLQGQGGFESQPEVPAELRMEIPADTGAGGGEPHYSASPDAIAFQVLGDRLIHQTIGPVRLITNSVQPIPVRILLSPLTRGDGEGESPTRWLTVRPSQGMVQRGHPFVFSVTAHMPDFLPDGMERGELRGHLRVISDAVQSDVAVNVSLRVQIAKIVVAGVKAGRIPRLFYALRCLLPGHQSRTLKLTTGAMVAHPGVVKLGRPEPLTGGQGWLQPGQLTLTIPTETAGVLELPPDGETIALPLRVDAGRGVPRGRYRGEILIAGENLLPARLTYEIDLPRHTWQERVVMDFIPLLVCILLVLVVWVALWRTRRYPEGLRFTLRADEVGQDGWNFAGRFQVRPRGGGWIVDRANDLDVTVGGGKVGSNGQVLASNREISSGRYTFAVRNCDPKALTLEVRRSPNRPARWRTLAMVTMIAVCLLLVIRFWPAPILQLIQG